MLCLDIGVKHLGVCIGKKELIYWKLVNLIQPEKQECTTCSKPAKWIRPDGHTVCGIHLQKPVIRITKQNGTPSDKPTVAELCSFLKERDLDASGKRDVLFQRACTIATVPIPKIKSVASFASNTVQLHDAIRAWIEHDWNQLSQVTNVYIEHQPVYKNPVMKTVQMIVFVSLRERYLSEGMNPSFHFVHAGKKVKGETVGDEGYKDRKKAGIERTREYLNENKLEHWISYLDSLSKKDDVCDALCMWLDVK